MLRELPPAGGFTCPLEPAGTCEGEASGRYSPDELSTALRRAASRLAPHYQEVDQT